MGTYKTDQEKFWAGEFGRKYIQRNFDEDLLMRKTAMFVKTFEKMSRVGSIMEFGANVGLNLVAIKRLLPDLELSALEINPNAVEALKKIQGVKVYHSSILDFDPDCTRDLVFTSGVLIHQAPDSLPEVYDRLYRSTHRYLLMIEYYNPTPVEIGYRGHCGYLFKRDFAGEMLDRYKDLELMDYGFIYHRDKLFPQDDLTWFLMEKR